MAHGAVKNCRYVDNGLTDRYDLTVAHLNPD